MKFLLFTCAEEFFFSPAPSRRSDRLCCAVRGRKRLLGIEHRTCFRSACRIGWERGSVGAPFYGCMLHLDLTSYAWPFTPDSMTRYMSHPVCFHLAAPKPNDGSWAPLEISPPISNHNLPSTSWGFFFGKAGSTQPKTNRWFHGAEIIV